MLLPKFGNWFPRWEVLGLRHKTQNDPEGEISPDPKISLLGKWQCKLPHWGLNLLACGCDLLWETGWFWWALWLDLECCDASLRIAYVMECEPFICGQTSILYDLLWQNCDFTCRNEGAVQYPSCAYVSKFKDMANCNIMLLCWHVDYVIHPAISLYGNGTLVLSILCSTVCGAMKQKHQSTNAILGKSTWYHWDAQCIQMCIPTVWKVRDQSGCTIM